MKTIDIKVQVIEDNFIAFRANAERKLATMLPEILNHVKKGNTVTYPGELQLLIARQITFPTGESLTDLQVKPGEYLILFQPSMSDVKLTLHLPKQFKAPPFVVEKSEAMIGRSNEFNPDVDLEKYLKDPTVVSRKVAWLREDDGKWYIEIDPDCHSGVFVNEMRLVVNTRTELQDRAVITFGISLDKPDLRLAVSLANK